MDSIISTLMNVLQYRFQRRLLIGGHCFVSITICNSVEHVTIDPLQVFPHFLQPKGPLTYSQEPSTFAYPKQHELSTQNSNLCLEDPF